MAQIQRNAPRFPAHLPRVSNADSTRRRCRSSAVSTCRANESHAHITREEYPASRQLEYKLRWARHPDRGTAGRHPEQSAQRG
ncbi:MAG: hypothetical protein ACLRG7_09825, partial [Eggerthella lenta]